MFTPCEYSASHDEVETIEWFDFVGYRLSRKIRTLTDFFFFNIYKYLLVIPKKALKLFKIYPFIQLT